MGQAGFGEVLQVRSPGRKTAKLRKLPPHLSLFEWPPSSPHPQEQGPQPMLSTGLFKRTSKVSPRWMIYPIQGRIQAQWSKFSSYPCAYDQPRWHLFTRAPPSLCIKLLCISVYFPFFTFPYRRMTYKQMANESKCAIFTREWGHWGKEFLPKLTLSALWLGSWAPPYSSETTWLPHCSKFP